MPRYYKPNLQGLEELQGDGLLDWIRNLKNVVLNPNKALISIPKPVTDFLQKYGSYKIVSINVCREPLQQMIIKLGDKLTDGKLTENRKNLNYDDVFHLYISLQITQGSETKTVLLEKNQRVIVEIKDKQPKVGGQCVPVRMNKSIDLNTFMMTNINSNTWLYDAVNFNCQDYVSKRLQSNGMMTPELNTFINQDVNQLLPNKVLQKIAKGATNIASLLQNIYSGGEYM